jgi:hypothetical protein
MSEVATTMRERVVRLESIVGQAPQVDCPIRNHFAPGLYAREMTIPADVIATGAVHKTEHLSILSAGHCFLTTDDGVQELRAPFTCVSKAGAKRAIYAITECVFTTIHPTDETDLDKLCEQLTDTTTAELIGGPKNRQLLANEKQTLGEHL